MNDILSQVKSKATLPVVKSQFFDADRKTR